MIFYRPCIDDIALVADQCVPAVSSKHVEKVLDFLTTLGFKILYMYFVNVL